MHIKQNLKVTETVDLKRNSRIQDEAEANKSRIR